MTAPAAPAAPVDWGRRNLRLLAVFGPVLIATGVAGLTLPPGLSLMSAAAPYDIFHIVFGTLGLAIVLGRSARFAGLFNLGFGAVDLYQAVAGVVGIFPAIPFGYDRPITWSTSCSVSCWWSSALTVQIRSMPLCREARIRSRPAPAL